jgi:hypothetical protein
MAPVVLAVWGVVRLVQAAEPPSLDIPPAPPGQVQPQVHLQAQAPARPPATPPVVVRGLDRSAPTRIVIPSLWINAPIDQLGLRPDGTLETPSFQRSRNAAWYKYGPSPGEVGPAVILGHVDNKTDRAVFFELRRIKVGAKIEISRADGSKLLFTVDSVEQFPKTNFPTARVYGQTSGPALRLVTCGGKFDRARGDYLDNIIVFASLAA